MEAMKRPIRPWSKSKPRRALTPMARVGRGPPPGGHPRFPWVGECRHARRREASTRNRTGLTTGIQATNHRGKAKRETRKGEGGRASPFPFRLSLFAFRLLLISHHPTEGPARAFLRQPRPEPSGDPHGG